VTMSEAAGQEPGEPDAADRPESGRWPCEDDMLARAATGEMLDLGTSPLDPERLKAWGQDRTIRASVLRRLLVEDEWPVHSKGVLLRGVKISGFLDLATATLRCPLLLDHCYLDGPPPALGYATATILGILNSVMPGLTADSLTVTRDISLAGSVFTGPVSLNGAQITGSLTCSGANLNGVDANGNALLASNLKVSRDVFLLNGFTAAGALWLLGANIAGSLECDGAKLNGANTAGLALVGERLTVGGNILFRNGFTAAGAISLAGADIAGNLECEGKLNRANARGVALVGERVQVGGDALLRGEFATVGAVSLLGANIAGNLECGGAKLAGADVDGNALVADNLRVGRNALLWDGFAAAGAIRLPGANITGSLNCRRAKLNGIDANGAALIAENLTVGQDIFLQYGFTAAGAISLLGANVAGNFECQGAKLNGVDGDGNALVADTLTVGHDAFLGNGFTAAGAISLLGANVAGNLECDGAMLNGADGNGNALVADTLTVGHDAFLGNGFTAAGAISLLGANVAGNLECDGAKLNGVDGNGNALVADGMTVGHDAFLGNGFTAAGGISLLGADIVGNLECGGAKLAAVSERGNALSADNMKVGGDLHLREGFTAAGAITLVGAKITGNLDCDGDKLQGTNQFGNVLVADNLTVGRNAQFRNGFTAAGALWLIGADITGNFDLEGATLAGVNSSRLALVAERLKVGGDALLRNGFTSVGALRLLGADIKSDLDCQGAKLNGADESGNALIADNLKVGRNALLRHGFTAAGAIHLVGAEISGSLDCDGALLTASEGKVLVADGVKVGRDVRLGGGFTATGTISLESAQIAGSLSAGIAKPSGTETETAFHASGMQIAHELRWEPAKPFTGPVNLEDAQVGQLKDDWSGDRGVANGFWPVGGLLRLDGFRYNRLGGDHPATAEQRRGWIQSQFLPNRRGPIRRLFRKKGAAQDRTSRFATQPYEQLATVYQQGGQDTEARLIALARRQDVRQYGELTWYRLTLNWLVDKSIKYGYQTWRAVGLLAGLYLAAVMIFWAAQHHANLIMPVGPLPSGTAPTAMHCMSSYPCFYPAGYAIDVVIPIINVHQASYWGPNGHVPWGDALTIFTWLATALGWLLATLAVAGYTGLVRAADSI
jgi:predicted acyltransferase (DUF342 family)